eukprot:scaffold53661_cov63-Phaeocystis_antarctica.AAC.3
MPMQPREGLVLRASRRRHGQHRGIGCEIGRDIGRTRYTAEVAQLQDGAPSPPNVVAAGIVKSTRVFRFSALQSPVAVWGGDTCTTMFATFSAERGLFAGSASSPAKAWRLFPCGLSGMRKRVP